MPKIRNFVLPEPLVEALVDEVQSMPETLLLEWARECLPGGFTRVDLIRNRLAAQLRSEGAIDSRLLAMLTDAFPLRPTVEALSLNALQELHTAIEVVAGREVLLLALLFDPREEVHRWGIEQSAKPPADTSELAWQSADDQLFIFVDERFSIPLEVSLSEGVPNEPPPPGFVDFLKEGAIKELGDKVETQKKSIDRLNNELHQQKLRHTAKLKEQSDSLDRERKRIHAELAASQSQLTQARKEKQALEDRLKELSSKMEALVGRRVQEQTSALVRKWLSEPAATEAAAKESEASAADLLPRVDQVLAAQARQDRHTGNRIQLRARVESLEQARGRVLEALQNSIHPIQELNRLDADLAAEIAKYKRMLGIGAPRSELLNRILAEVNTAATFDDTRRTSTLADELAEHGLLSREERRELYHAIQRKFSLLQEAVPGTQPEGDTGWSLRDTIFRNKTALLLLDGHNILYSLRDIFGADYDNGHPGQRARQRLAGMVEKLLKDRGNLQAKVCFDGPDARSVRISPNVTLEYSGGSGPNRADELILSRLLFKDLKTLDQKVFVVTDDRQVRQGALQTGAKFVRTDLFAVLLGDFRCL